VADHGFHEQEAVLHPHFKTTEIGKTDRRFSEIDIARCKLYPEIKFTNNEYFEVAPPTRLVSSFEVSDEDGWYEIDVHGWLYPSSSHWFGIRYSRHSRKNLSRTSATTLV
jgi:hypothetical protein